MWHRDRDKEKEIERDVKRERKREREKEREREGERGGFPCSDSECTCFMQSLAVFNLQL